MMNRKMTLPLAAFAVSLGLLPAPVRAEDAPPPPPPQERPDRPQRPPMDGPRGGRMMPGLSEEERARLDELAKKVEQALAAYRENPGDETKAALKAQIGESFEVRQKIAVDRAEKALARARKRLENKDEEVEKQLQRMIRPRGERPQRPPRADNFRMGGEPAFGAPLPGGPRFGSDQKGGGKARGPFGRIFTADEGKQLQELNARLLKAASVTPEVRKEVESAGRIYQAALVRQQKALEKAKSEKKDTAALERSIGFLNQSIENARDPEKYLKQLKARPVRGAKENRKGAE